MVLKRVGIVLLWVLVIVPCLATAQAPSDTPVTNNSESAVDKVLTFVDSVAIAMGEGIVNLLNESLGLALPLVLGRILGYLIILTILLLLAFYVRISRIVILVGLALAWGLLIARFVTETLG